jgi:glycosyltransferase involved in cell wall biosynthesis
MISPLLSICIPLFNKAAYLERCFSHIACQGVSNYEVVVVDNASTDNPEPILKAWATRLPLRVFRLPVTLSIHESWAFTLGLASGSIRQLHSADDYLADGALARVFEAFQSQPELDFLVGRTVSIMDDGSAVTDLAVVNYHKQLEGWRGSIRPDLTVREKAAFLASMSLGQNFFGDVNPLFMRAKCVDFIRQAATTTAPLFHIVPDLEIYLKLYTQFRGAYLPQDTIYCTVNESSTYQKTRTDRDLALISYEIPALNALPFLSLHPVFRDVNREMGTRPLLKRWWSFTKRLLKPALRERFRIF